MKEEKTQKIFKAWIALIRSQQMCVAAVEKALKQAGLPPLSWYDVLLELNRTGEKVRLQALGAKVLLTKNNVTRLIDRLEAQNLVQRHKCMHDGRGVTASITPHGKALLKKMWPVYENAVQQCFGAFLTCEEQTLLTQLYARLKSTKF